MGLEFFEMETGAKIAEAQRRLSEMTVSTKVKNPEAVMRMIMLMENLPRHKLDMDTWYYHEDAGLVHTAGTVVKHREARKEDGKLHHCGTTACIAGWAVHELADNPRAYSDIEDYAKKMLGLNSAQAQELFYAMGLDEDPQTVAQVLKTYLTSGVMHVWGRYDDDTE